LAQIWLTYDELGDLFDCGSMAARQAVGQNAWPRRRCSDGLTRVKLPPAAAHEFIMKYADCVTGKFEPDESVRALREILARAKSSAGNQLSEIRQSSAS
jgi:hypothetical protein